MKPDQSVLMGCRLNISGQRLIAILTKVLSLPMRASRP